MELRFGREEGAFPAWSEASARATTVRALGVFVVSAVSAECCARPAVQSAESAATCMRGWENTHNLFPAFVLKTYVYLSVVA